MKLAWLGLLAWLMFISAANASYETSGAWFEDLTESERRELQSDLALLGYYSAFVDGEFGQSTYRAITAFEADERDQVDGTLPPALRIVAKKKARARYEELGFVQITEHSARIALAIPKRLTPVTHSHGAGAKYLGANAAIIITTFTGPPGVSMETLYADATDPKPGRSLDYYNYSTKRFVATGTEGARQFYTLCIRIPLGCSGFTVQWAPSERAKVLPVVYFMASSVQYTTAVEPDRSRTAVQPTPTVPSTDSEVVEEPDLSTVEVGSFVLLEGDEHIVALAGEIHSGTPLDFRRALNERPYARSEALPPLFWRTRSAFRRAALCSLAV